MITLNTVTFSSLGWLFTFAISLHNIEEALLLPKWSTRAGRWHVPVGAFEFRFAVFVLTFLAFILTYLSINYGPKTIATHILAGYALAMLLNVFMPHLFATMALRQYAPGTATAVIFNLPISSALLYVAFKDEYIELDKFVWYGPITVTVLLTSIPVLFFIGRQLRRSLFKA